MKKGELEQEKGVEPKETRINVAELLGNRDIEIARLNSLLQEEIEKNKILEKMIAEMKGKK